MIRRLLLLLSLLSTALFAAPPAAPGKRILFLGDSITFGATYVALVDAALILDEPGVKHQILSAGLSSETVSGLSEPGHAGGKFDRPTLHERLDRVLEKAKPDLVLACYGMNDGIYMPLADDRFKAYRDGMMKLHDKVIATGAKIIHITPPVYDPVAIPQKVDLSGEPGKNYAKYNDVLDAYSDWLLSQKQAAGWDVVDLHGPMKDALAKGRAADPAFVISKDGVHPGDLGHQLMAQPVLTAWGVKHTAAEAAQSDIFKLIKQKTELLRDAWLTEIGHKRPGVKAGLPVPEATEKAAVLDAQARSLLNKK